MSRFWIVDFALIIACMIKD
ncbi:hypothetical protein Avbf_15632 [Armadillidium vulgare]|nr:hypothetical protein Avbf_15632 [Armadillidium vulgare]